MSTGSDLTWVEGIRTLLRQGAYSEAVARTEQALAEPGNETNGQHVKKKNNKKKDTALARRRRARMT